MPSIPMSTTPIPDSQTGDITDDPTPPDSQWYFTEDELLLSPSILCGMTPSDEKQGRAKGVNFILQVGILLKLPQITLATASVFLHRFFMRYSMQKDPTGRRPDFHYYSVAAAALWLAAKVEENCRKMKELVIACVRVAQKDANKVVDEQDKEYWKWRDVILALEDRLLEGLCFDLNLESPYASLFSMLQNLGVEDNKELRNAAWAFINDSCLTPLCLLWPSKTIAAASIYAAARSCQIVFPDDEDGKPWWEAVGIQLLHIRKACNFMASVYENTPSRGPPNIYQRTPENGDERTAKTRMQNDGRADGSDGRATREASILSMAGSDVSKKRGNDDISGQAPASINDVPWGGQTVEERDAKRSKFDADQTGENGHESKGPAVKGTANGAAMTGDEAGQARNGSQDTKMDVDSGKSDGQPGAASPSPAGSEEGEVDE